MRTLHSTPLSSLVWLRRGHKPSGKANAIGAMCTVQCWSDSTHLPLLPSLSQEQGDPEHLGVLVSEIQYLNENMNLQIVR